MRGRFTPNLGADMMVVGGKGVKTAQPSKCVRNTSAKFRLYNYRPINSYFRAGLVELVI